MLAAATAPTEPWVLIVANNEDGDEMGGTLGEQPSVLDVGGGTF